MAKQLKKITKLHKEEAIAIAEPKKLSRSGPAPMYSDPDKLRADIAGYFDSVDARNAGKDKMEAIYTISGLQLALGVSDNCWADMANGVGAYSGTEAYINAIGAAKKRIYEAWVQSAVFKRIDTIYGIFYGKAALGMRDNDGPIQMTADNVNVSVSVMKP